MRLKKPEPFDPGKEYKIGERFIYQNKTLVCVKYKRIARAYTKMYLDANLFPTQCGLCRVNYSDCKGVCDSPCQKYNRTDRKEVNYKLLRFNKK